MLATITVPVGAEAPTDAVDDEPRCAQAANPGARGIEEVAEVHNFRFAGRAVECAGPPCETGGDHHVGRPGDGASLRAGQVDLGARQAVGFGEDITPVDGDPRPQGTKSLEMQVDGTMPDVTAPGQRHAGPAATGQKPIRMTGPDCARTSAGAASVAAPIAAPWIRRRRVALKAKGALR